MLKIVKYILYIINAPSTWNLQIPDVREIKTNFVVDYCVVFQVHIERAVINYQLIYFANRCEFNL